MQEICNNLEIVEKYPWNVSKKFRKISHQELDISPYTPYFSKEVGQLIDLKTDKKFMTIWI